MSPSPLRVLVCEYVTGGGLRGADLPASLVAEARLMRDAMVRDLSALPQPVELLLTHDDRLAAPAPGSRPIGPGDDPFALWSALACTAHVAWPVAPETGGVLARLVRELAASGARVAASTPAAVEIAASKHATAARLAAAGVPHIPTFAPGEAEEALGADRITKPDDGAGCEDTRRWPAGRRAEPGPGHVIQPYVAGEAASLTVLMRGGEAQLLCANRQHIREVEGRLFLAGLGVGAIADDDGRLARLAQQVANAIPGLAGIVGMDVILTAAGPVVVEVNPRLTTAYAGLAAALGINPAGLLPEFGAAGSGPAPRARTVEMGLA
ncbi:ATP-grasp domain-containing protein [Xanthobacter sp. AM11]|uniref:ATP-grasp domain-containing protein n=1 Tax=Xanthobacter sp. AM11 TaxID=3380643 RepID=UPI0039BFB226